MRTERSTSGFLFAFIALFAVMLVFATPAGIPVPDADDATSTDPWSAEGIRDWFADNVLGTESSFEPITVPDQAAQSDS